MAQWWLSSGSVLAWQWQCPSDGSSVAQWWLGSGRGMIRACQWLSSGLPVTVAQCWLGSGPVVAWQWQWHSDGSVVALMQHVLVATRGWCCLVEGPAADGLTPLGQCAQTQPPATQQIHSLQWAQHFPHPSQDSAESLVCITDPPQDSFITVGLLAPRLCTGTSVVQMQLTGVGKGRSCPEKEAVSHGAPASHSLGKAEVQYPASPPPMGTSAA